MSETAAKGWSAQRAMDPALARPAKWPRIWIATAIALGLLFVAVTVQKIWAADFWWQLRTGRWILENRKLPTTDEFSYTVKDHVWIELRWIYCLLLYLGWRAGGATLLVLAQAGAIGAAFFTIIWPSRRTLWQGGWIGVLAGLMVACALLAGMFRWVLRPELVSLVMLGVYLVVLEQFTLGKWRRAAWLLPLVQIVWTNSHTLFILGPVTAWMFVAGAAGQLVATRLGVLAADSEESGAEAWRKGLKDFGRVTAMAVAISAACWVNPWGHAGAMFPFILYREVQPGHVLARAITEFASPLAAPLAQWRWDFWMQAVLIGLVGFTFVLTWRSTRMWRLVVLAAAAYLASMSQRNCSLLSIMGLWVGLANLRDADLPGAATRLVARLRGTGIWPVVGHAAVFCGTLFSAWYVATDRYSVRQSALREFGLGIVWPNSPRAAVDFMIRERLAPQVYNSMADAAYQIWAGGDRYPVFVDGRLEVYGDAFLSEYFEPKAGYVRFDQLSERWGINTVLVPRDGFENLAAQLTAKPEWVLVHIDHRDLVFVRNTPHHRDVIGKYRIDPSQRYEPREPEPAEAGPAWRRAVGGVDRPWFSDGMARSFLSIGSSRNAVAYAERAVAAFPADWRSWMTLGHACVASRNWARAKEALERGIASGSPAGADYGALGIAQEQLSQPEAAIESYRRCLRMDPGQAQIWNQLGVLLVRRFNLAGARGSPGDLAEALRCFENALRVQPSYESARANLEKLRQALRQSP